jgi:lysine decarboxylase
MSSLDVARRELAIYGQQRYSQLKSIVDAAIEEIENNSRYEVLQAEYVQENFKQSYDWTKLVIRVNDIGLTGFEVYTILKQQYGIQLELAEGYVIMAVISHVDTNETIGKLVHALKDIELNHAKKEAIQSAHVTANQINRLAMTPQQACNAETETILIYDAVGRISADTLMIYPPGIPLVIPGEVISEELVELYNFYFHNFGNVLNETKEENYITVVRETNK